MALNSASLLGFLGGESTHLKLDLSVLQFVHLLCYNLTTSSSIIWFDTKTTCTFPSQSNQIKRKIFKLGNAI